MIGKSCSDEQEAGAPFCLHKLSAIEKTEARSASPSSPAALLEEECTSLLGFQFCLIQLLLAQILLDAIVSYSCSTN